MTWNEDRYIALGRGGQWSVRWRLLRGLLKVAGRAPAPLRAPPPAPEPAPEDEPGGLPRYMQTGDHGEHRRDKCDHYTPEYARAQIKQQNENRARRKRLREYAGMAGKVALPKDRILATQVWMMWNDEAKGRPWF